MLTTLLTLALATAQLQAADPPKLDCLSDVSIEGLWQGPTRPYIHNDEWLVGPLIILVGRHDDPDPDATWGVFNDPAIKDYFTQEQITLIFHQDGVPGVRSEADRLPFSFGDGDRVHLRSASGEFQSGKWNLFQWPTSPPNPGELLEWINEPEQKQRQRSAEFHTLSEKIELNPSDIKLRHEAIALCESIGGYPPMAHRFVPWLLLNHDRWYDYESGASEAELSEEQFRTVVFERIRSAREQLDLFSGFMGYGSGADNEGWSFDDWVEKEIWKSRSFTFGNGIQTPGKTMPWEWAYSVQSMRDHCELNGYSDRDRFILHALTAEGEEWQELIEQHAPDSQ